jgi:hypothetical protein
VQNWGRKEHKWENYTNLMLVIGSLSAGAYLYYHWNWLITFTMWWMMATTLIHLIARMFHLFEKWSYRSRGR